MRDEADLLLFGHVVAKSECDCGIEAAALLVAEAEYKGLDVARYVAKLDRLGRSARKWLAAREQALAGVRAQASLERLERLDDLEGCEGLASRVGQDIAGTDLQHLQHLERLHGADAVFAGEPASDLLPDQLRGAQMRGADVAPDAPIVGVLEYLYDELGFRGNVVDYYDPRNSFLSDVLDRRLGIPITLALVIMAVCRRLHIPAEGVSFPGHFLVRSVDGTGQPVFVDPFDGRVLDAESLQLLYEQTTGDAAEFDPGLLCPAGRRQILARLLNNLRAIYEVRGDRKRLRRILQQMAVLNPSPELDGRLALLGKNVSLPARMTVN